MTDEPASPRDMPDPRTQALLQYQPWLQLLARLEIESRFAGKFSASDAVQQTLLEAWRGWDAFRGEGDAGRRAWLRGILAHQLAHLGRAFVAQKRDLARECSLDVSLAHTSLRLAGLLAADQTSPSAPLQAEEKSLELARVLESLPEDYRQVIILRNLEELPYEAIADRMQRTPGAIRMLWLRALAALQEQVRSSSLRG